MAKCLCAIVDAEGRVVLERTGYVKQYRDKGGQPFAPGHVAPHQVREYVGDLIPVEDKDRWLADISYRLCYCPHCMTVAGKKHQYHTSQEVA